jgi:hypothetical protein
MDEEAYLQRLKSIRDKYGCKDSNQYYPKTTDKFYTKNDVSHHDYNTTNVNQYKQSQPSFAYSK